MNRTKTYPIEIETLYDADGGDMSLGYWSKGHHSVESMLAALDHEFGPEKRMFAKDVRRIWWRCVPTNNDEGCSYMFVEAKPGSRGAFPATVIDR